VKLVDVRKEVQCPICLGNDMLCELAFHFQSSSLLWRGSLLITSLSIVVKCYCYLDVRLLLVFATKY